MKIDSLTLSDFRSHQQSQLQLDRINVVRGRNGSGKSSIQIAIEFLLTGKCNVTDAAGRGADSLIRLGAMEFQVKADIGKEVIVARRSATGGSTTVGNFAAGKAAQHWIEGNIAPLSVLSACLDSYRFLEMKPAEQKALLAQVLADEPIALDAKLIDLQKQVPEIRVLNEIRNVADVDLQHDSYYKLRTLVNRDLKNLGDVAEPQLPDGYRTPADVRGSIDELRKEREGKVKERARITGSASQNDVARMAAEAQKTSAESRLLTTKNIDAHRKTLKGKDRATELDAEIEQLQAIITDKRKSIVAADSQPTNCPSCHRPLETTKIDTVAMREDVKQLEADLQKKQTARIKLGDWQTSDIQLKQHADAAAQIVNADIVLKNLTTKSAPDTSELDAAITKLDERIKNGEEILSTVTKLEGAVQQYSQTKRKKDELAKKSILLDQLVEAFSDKSGLKAKLVGGKLPAFRDRVNSVLARFGFVCFFDLDPYRLTVAPTVYRRPGDAPLELHQLSESEAYRFGIAFQIALAEVTGVNFVLIDRADMLVPASRQFLTMALLESNLDQAIILSTGEPTGDVPAIPGVAFFNLFNETGTTSVIRAGAGQEEYAAAK